MQEEEKDHPRPASGPGVPPRILHYLDFRDFIRDHCAWRKRLEPAFSQRVFAREADLPPSCSSLLPGVVNARRNLSANLRIKFGKALGLSEKDYRYFDLLVQFNQAKGMIEKNHFFAQLSRFRDSRARIVGEAQYRYYTKWHHSAVWTYFTLDQKQRHAGLIGARLFPAATAAQVEESIHLLLTLGLIKKTASGYTVTDKHLTTEKDLKAMATRQYLHDLTGLAMGALDTVPAEHRQFSALMFSVSETGFRTLKDRIGSFQEELREIVDKDSGEDRIYTLTMQLFPNSQSEAGPGLGFTAAKKRDAGKSP
ncbi:MAG: TIGR02147 family protein [Fibrobacteria bacterium]